MDNLDDLSNEQLRLKLMEYGLANMPVTQTTRKVLIKKLKNHLDSANTKVRRDTVHIVKYSSDEDSEMTEETKKVQKKEVSRRATIGGSAAKLSKTLPVMPQLPPPKPTVTEKSDKIEPSQKRRSGRLTPVQNKETVAPTVAVPKEPMIVENSDDEDDIPLTQLDRRDRSSKSPSLTRAEMVTTSYIHQVDIPPKPAITETMEIDLTESTDDVEMQSPVPERYTRPPTTPSRESRYTSSTTSTIINNRTTVTGTPGLSQTRQPELSSSFGRPSISTSYNYKPFQAEPREELKLQPTDSPYLSEFTKRLSRLKAENAQLNAVRDHPIRRTIASSYASSRIDGNGGRDYTSARLSSIRGSDRLGNLAAPGGRGEIRASLRQVILALDQKYPIKRMFYLLIVTMIVIFLFVFFFL
ncbi:otefin [Topomyia yanbarensis]|uniref:otefin n=1 Tax=Topomyia yanbarensis TaxID=2498891 RepID=UPI00273BF654|nr:otefin [Topomyia yanbarensis]